MDSGNQQKLRAAVVLLISFVLFGFSRSVEAQGAQIIVNTTADTIDVNPFDGICADAAGRCSLRAAIMTANAMPGVQSIFLRDGIYRITRLGKDNNAVNGDFDIRDSVVIIGAGPASTIIDANLVGHAFEVPDLFRSITLSITGVTIQNANGEEQYAIYSRGNNSLALTNSVIRDNYGGVWVTGDSVIDNVTFTGNRYETLTNRGGTMILRNSRVDGNITDDTFNFNSFIVYNSGTMTVTNTRFTNNYRQNGSGGAVYNTGYLRVRDTLFENNRSRSDGGALYHIGSSGVTEINRTRFINNSVDNRAGGAIYALEGTVNIRNSVFDGNQASPELRSFGGGGSNQ